MIGQSMADRAALSNTFLAAAGWSAANRQFLAGDASDRTYDRLTLPKKTAVLMDAPLGRGDDPAVFLQVAAHLRKIGLSAPDCYARDLENGFLLLEDLGDDLFAKYIPANPHLEQPLYQAATNVLIALQNHAPLDDLPDLSARDWADAAGFVIDWYRFAICGDAADPSHLTDPLADHILRHADGPRVMILRDFHAENLLWLPDRVGLAQVGLLDFQLAQLGQPGYDLVSLLQDARRDVPLAIEAAMVRHICDATSKNHAEFQATYAVLGAQRALRILGIFARLCLKSAKPGYIALIPRVWEHLQRNLAHPALAEMQRVCTDLLPEPTPDRLQRIAQQCGKYPTR